jgi:lactate dehydrogenase-like 2-hydroxyacid dehydrogenase
MFTESNQGQFISMPMAKEAGMLRMFRIEGITLVLSRYREGAGLDVFWEEPVDPDDPVFRYNILATTHIAGSTHISINGIVKVVAENIKRLDWGQEPLYQNK